MVSVKEFASNLSREAKWHGNHNENNRQLILKAGQLEMFYENGNLRYISARGFEIVRMVYSAVRNSEWLTIKPVISEEEFAVTSDTFRIKYSAHYLAENINFLAHYSIIGNSDNSLIFTLEGVALDSFKKNRIGFCLLHPVEGNKGEYCTIVHSDNQAELLTFPYFISPHQPFRDIKSMMWERADIRCLVNFSGDIFETEDHRNWSDASYKTYCTPLNLPYPVKINKGEKISQKIELRVFSGETAGNDKSGQVSISINRERIHSFPKIGIGRSTRPYPLTYDESAILKMIHFDHYRIDLHLYRDDWKSVLANGLSEGELLGYKAELALFFDDDYDVQIQGFIDAIKPVKADIAVILLFHKTRPSTPGFFIDRTAPALKEVLLGVKICCGTNANFAEINRNRPATVNADYLCYSIHPQEHANDNLTLVENLKSQQCTVESARAFSDIKPVWVSQVTIQRRFNANVTFYEQVSDGITFPIQVDSRLMSLFGGCWTSGSLKYLVDGGIEGVTLLETVGERGIIQGAFSSRWPDDFQSCSGMIFPVYFVIKYILDNKNFGIAECTSSHPLNADALVLINGDKIKAIIVNFTHLTQKVSLNGFPDELNHKSLNDRTYNDAVSDTDWLENAKTRLIRNSDFIFLEPYSISFIEG